MEAARSGMGWRLLRTRSIQRKFSKLDLRRRRLNNAAARAIPLFDLAVHATLVAPSISAVGTKRMALSSTLRGYIRGFRTGRNGSFPPALFECRIAWGTNPRQTTAAV
jgi:hypothetical protein